MENTENFTINTSNLSPGMIVKNYKEMCELLGEKVKGGDSKKAQIAEWARYFSFEKPEKKKSYYILEIYETPLPKVENRGRQSKYVKYIETILLDFLLTQPNHSASLVQKEWWHKLGMVSANFSSANETCEHITKVHKNIDKRFVYSFYERVCRKNNSVLKSALKSLVSRRLIIYNNEIIIICGKKTHSATIQETENILKAERHVLTEVFEYDTIQDIYRNYCQEDYYIKVNEYIKEHYNYDGYYTKLEIIHNKEDVRKALSDSDIWVNKFNLNDELKLYYTNQAETYYNKWEANYYNGRALFLDDTYLETQKILIEDLINIKPHKQEIIDKYFIIKEKPREVIVDETIDPESVYDALDREEELDYSSDRSQKSKCNNFTKNKESLLNNPFWNNEPFSEEEESLFFGVC